MTDEFDYVFEETPKEIAVREHKTEINRIFDYYYQHCDEQRAKHDAAFLSAFEYKIEYLLSRISHNKKIDAIAEYVGIPVEVAPFEERDKHDGLGSLQKLHRILTVLEMLYDVLIHDYKSMKSLASTDPGAYAQLHAYRIRGLMSCNRNGKYAKNLLDEVIERRLSDKQDHIQWNDHVGALVINHQMRVTPQFETFIDQKNNIVHGST